MLSGVVRGGMLSAAAGQRVRLASTAAKSFPANKVGEGRLRGEMGRGTSCGRVSGV
jgi:hypothetical protein